MSWRKLQDCQWSRLYKLSVKWKASCGTFRRTCVNWVRRVPRGMTLSRGSKISTTCRYPVFFPFSDVPPRTIHRFFWSPRSFKREMLSTASHGHPITIRSFIVCWNCQVYICIQLICRSIPPCFIRRLWCPNMILLGPFPFISIR